MKDHLLKLDGIESNSRLAANGLFGAANGTKALLELVDTSFGVNKRTQASVERVRVGREADGNDEVLHSVDLLGLVRLGGGTGEEAVTSGHVLEGYRMVGRMDVFFHGMPLKVRVATLPTPHGWELSQNGLAVNRIPAYPAREMNLKTFATMDPHLLVGLVNTELRNNAKSLSDLCKTHGLKQKELVARLASADFHYNDETKQFR